MRLGKLVAMATVLIGAAGARASEGGEDARDEQVLARPTELALRDGAFGTLAMPARVGSTAAVAFGSGGYDAAGKAPLLDVGAEVRLWGPIALRAGAGYSSRTNRMRPSFGARAQWLRQESHGVDGAVSLSYKAEGFTEAEGEVEAVLSLGRTFGALSAVANLAYGQDPEGNERDGEVRAFVGRRWERVSLGLDARARSALGAQRGAAATAEPKYDLMAGPIAIALVGPVAFFVEAGPSAIKMPLAPTRFGLASFAGVGSAF